MGLVATLLDITDVEHVCHHRKPSWTARQSPAREVDSSSCRAPGSSCAARNIRPTPALPAWKLRNTRPRVTCALIQGRTTRPERNPSCALPAEHLCYLSQAGLRDRQPPLICHLYRKRFPSLLLFFFFSYCSFFMNIFLDPINI